MKVLAVTGRLAEGSVRRTVSGLGVEVDVLSLPVSVAAFITPESAARHLRGRTMEGYDLILLPGVVRGDVSPVEEVTGVATFKGPSDVNELSLVLELLGEIELSKTVSATELIRGHKSERALGEIRRVEEDWRGLLKEHGGFVLGGDGYEVPVGAAFPMRVIAEIVNAPALDLEAVRKRAAYYESEGADVIDIGMLAGDPRPEVVDGLVEAVRSSVSLPVSIDTLDPGEIEAAAGAGIDLVLSVDRGNLEEVAPYVRDVPVVVLPSDMGRGILPGTAEERLIAMMENLLLAGNLGVGKVIADLVLEPAVKPGLFESLKAYHLFRLTDEVTPVLFGLGNVTELIDADSPGVNGLLAALACEVGADLLFVPEYSSKARGSVRETVTASRMMFLARRREKPPKDLGLDLLLLKEKRWTETPYDGEEEASVEVLEAQEDEEFVMDAKGWFVIRIDRESDLIVATHYRERGRPDVAVKGRVAREIYQTILRRGLVGKYDHAAYLGKELTKAELALRIGRSYVQDGNLF